MTTKDQILSILSKSTARADAATEGPLFAHKYPDVKTWTVAAEESVASKIKIEADAKLFAAARTDLPARDAALRVAVEELSGSCLCQSECPCSFCSALARILEILQQKP